MGMVIRVAFNNQNWAANCVNADRDRRLFQCKEHVVDSGYQVDSDGVCLARCWESNLCKDFRWVSSVGSFGDRANGEVFLFFKDINELLVLWGKSKVKRVESNTIHLARFRPFPEGKWVRNISYSDLEQMGVPKWGSGTFRYIDDVIVNKLNELVKKSDSYFEDPIEPFTDLEGGKALRTHLVAERSSRLVKEFKQTLTGFKCVVCGFDFGDTYGEVGEGFIEAHHKKPIASLKKDEKVSTEDLEPVCSNCHRMLHKTNPLLPTEELRLIFETQKKISGNPSYGGRGRR